MSFLDQLTRGRAQILTRSLYFLASALGVGAILLQLAPDAPENALRDITSAAPRQANSTRLVFRRFAELLSDRLDPFSFRDLPRVQVQLRQHAEEGKPPPPDLSGVELAGTAPGKHGAYALVRDRQTNLVSLIEPGAELRGLKVRDIRPDRLMLADAENEMELVLSAVKGSDALSQQVKGGLPADFGVPKTGKAVPGAAGADAPKTAPERPERSIGVSGYILPPGEQEELGLKQSGLLITFVQSEQPSMQVDDVLLSINNQSFSSLEEAMSILQQVKGNEVAVRLLRNGAKLDVKATLK